MDAVFERVLQISLSGSIIVLAVLALRLVLKNAPKRAVCLLWMLAVLRLLVPFEIQSDWSMQPPPPEFVPPQMQEEFVDSGTVQSPIPPEYLENTVEYPLDRPPAQVKITDVLPWLWVLGAVLLAVHGAVSYIRLKRRVRDAVILEEGVWLCPGLDTAFVLGFFRPQIYLPVLNQEERELVLLHERCHIRRGDHWWKLLAYATVSIHWFNPLAWVTYILMCRDMELACDQETVKSMDNAKRKAYSAALLNCAAKRSGIAVCPVAFGEISVKERINMVLHYKKPGFWVTVVALVAAVAVGFFLLTSPKTDLERCERALKQWQEMGSYHFSERGTYQGDYVLNDRAEVGYWSSGSERLMHWDDGAGQGYWVHWSEGVAYRRDYGSLDPDWQDTGWEVAQFPESGLVPWVMELRWEDLTIENWEASDDGRVVYLTVDDPELDSMVLGFYFLENEVLHSVSRSYVLGEPEIGSSACVDIVELENQDPERIEQDINKFGAAPEISRFYNEPRVRREEFICTDSGDHCLSGHGHDTHH